MPAPDSQDVISRCRELAAISEITDGACRTFLSTAMKCCYALVGEWMKTAGLTVSVDSAGNLRGARSGADPGKRVLLMGSHLDTVRNAGAFDGVLGVMIAIALAEISAQSRLPFDLEIIGFSEEEGVRFGIPFIGSRALVGLLDEQALQRTDSAGISVAQAIDDFGLDPLEIPNAARKTPPLGFLEFHIEQGPVLDVADESVGIVEAIAGQSRASVRFLGSANHAGTTPMHRRRDALAAAAQWIGVVEHLACATPGLVATNGKIDSQPNVGNVIAGDATVSLDVRHADDSLRQRAYEDLHHAASEIAAKRRLELVWTELLSQKAVRMSDKLAAALDSCTAKTGITARRMVSGAGHDAMILAPHIPSAMLFLRSPGGISHHPAESVRPEDVEIALQIGRNFLDLMSTAYYNLESTP